MSASTPIEPTMRPILAAIAALGRAGAIRPRTARPASPFVTISREAGAGGRTLARTLVEALNRRGRGNPPWQAFDRELVEKVARDHHISELLIASLEDASHNWLKDILSGLSVEPSELTVFKRVAQTIRAIARTGNAVIVGRGGVFVTRSLPGGVHVRLVAPLETRIENTMRHLGLSRDEAARRVQAIARNRATFHRRYCGVEAPRADLFTVVFNTARVDVPEITEMLLPLIPGPPPV